MPDTTFIGVNYFSPSSIVLAASTNGNIDLNPLPKFSPESDDGIATVAKDPAATGPWPRSITAPTEQLANSGKR